MGCDIHLHIEAKINGKWEHLSNPLVERSYPLFAIMANIYNLENNIKPITNPRGLPIDISDETRRDYCEEMFFGESWLSDEEIPILQRRYADYMKKTWEYDNADAIKDSLQIEYPSPLGEIRLIFWFDN